MPVFDEIKKYTVYVAHSDPTSYDRSISLSLESGETAFIAFPPVRPLDWLTFSGSRTTLYMSLDHYNDIYHLLQTENPIFFTALKFEGLRVGGVHTKFDFAQPPDRARQGEPTGEGYRDQSIATIMLHAKAQMDAQEPN